MHATISPCVFISHLVSLSCEWPLSVSLGGQARGTAWHDTTWHDMIDRCEITNNQTAKDEHTQYCILHIWGSISTVHIACSYLLTAPNFPHSSCVLITYTTNACKVQFSMYLYVHIYIGVHSSIHPHRRVVRYNYSVGGVHVVATCPQPATQAHRMEREWMNEWRIKECMSLN